MGVGGTTFLVLILVASSSGFSLKDFLNKLKNLPLIIGNKIKDIIKPSDVCFQNLGCFNMSSPWHTLERPVPLPHSPEEVDTTFYMYSRASPKEYKITELSTETLMIDNSKTTHFIIHGMQGSLESVWAHEMREVLLKKYDCHVFVVDWSKGAESVNYLQDVSNTRVAAAETIRLLRYLIDKHGLKLTHLHLVGHSLGAHIASYVAKNITGVARITALDPAQPMFEGFDKQVRLDKSDAELVMVVHTDARPFVPLMGLGMMEPVGHIDFYVNGGFAQPGCQRNRRKRQMDFSGGGAVEMLVRVFTDFYKEYQRTVPCSHGRANYIFIAALSSPNCTFWGHKIANTTQLFGDRHDRIRHNDTECTADTCVPLAMEATYYPARGIFDVPTSGIKPFCEIQPHNDEEMKVLSTKISSDQTRIW